MAPKRRTVDKVSAGTGNAADSGSTPNVIGENDPSQMSSEPSASADPDPEELALGNQIQEMLDTINEHMDEVISIHNMSRQAAQLLAKTNESNSALEARTRTLRMQLIVIREKYPTIAKGKLSIRPRNPQKDYNNEDLDP
ncbi:hypothetical protein M422DRAFT_259708 [Sphaerobolus stellatus SS14]|uniref:KxDL homolog n=1 Tax=Sphaerobolus stellatus (strain SS14) TaxID=990650 RepID=A0A0C9USN8_SPHS4|nr:hypothetical protein M422DRAFT_259708 [Sphaerobolus stellatus SS14]